MSDSISRKGAIELIKDQAGCNSCDSYDGVRCRACTYDDVMDLIDCMPDSYDWIPVSEQLPNEAESVIVTVRNAQGDTPYEHTTTAWYYDGIWIADNDLMCGNVIAWMPLPEPYQENEE